MVFETKYLGLNYIRNHLHSQKVFFTSENRTPYN